MINLLIDTREKNFGHIIKEFTKNGKVAYKKKLEFGDYTFIYNNYSYENEIIIERKANLDELATNFTKHRTRFKNEFIRANAADVKKIILLIENATQEDILNHNYRSKFHPNAYIGSLNSWHKKYYIDIYFCKEIKYTWKIIYNIFMQYLSIKNKHYLHIK